MRRRATPARGRVVALIMLVVLAACAQSTRHDVIKTTLIATNAARDAFVAYDAARQAGIVEKAASLEDGKAQLASYRAARDKVLAIFPVVYYSIMAAAQANDDASTAKMKASLKALLDAMDPLLGGPR